MLAATDVRVLEAIGIEPQVGEQLPLVVGLECSTHEMVERLQMERFAEQRDDAKRSCASAVSSTKFCFAWFRVAQLSLKPTAARVDSA
jgi:hypothetical protein